MYGDGGLIEMRVHTLDRKNLLLNFVYTLQSPTVSINGNVKKLFSMFVHCNIAVSLCHYASKKLNKCKILQLDI